MLHHPTDRTLYLVECADLDADRPPAVVRDHAAILSRTVQWAREYLCQPNADLGRAGAVCPFVETSMKQGHFYLTVSSDQPVTVQQAADYVSRYCDWFPTLEPRSGTSAQFKTILILFPQPDVVGVSRIVESAQARLKASCVARGLMIGEFHPGPPQQRGLWNSEFRPFFSPVPLLGIRHMVPSDFAFVQNDPSLVLEYMRRFGNDVPLHLRDRVHEARAGLGFTAEPGDADCLAASHLPTQHMAVVNFKDKLGRFSDHWAPKVVAEMNDYQFKLVKILGEFVWHRHLDTDEVFIVLEGAMSIELRDRRVVLEAGEMFVVPKGVEHKPVAAVECKIMLVEPRGVLNTGEPGHRYTAANDVWI